ncbi:MAG: porphobilinogen synthase [Trueperaceae bacterium]|nr:porphobilinogen synthase [Trueperaceae bacterium]
MTLSKTLASKTLASKTQLNLNLSKRPRRLRSSEAMRNLVADSYVQAKDLMAPFFVVPGHGERQVIGALPGVSRFSVDQLMPELERCLSLGIKSVVLFGVVPELQKSFQAEAAYDPNGPVNKALREARKAFGQDLVLITDVCLCAYTDHGHCGILKSGSRGYTIDNDTSLELLAQMALSHAEAGADLVSPSDMMDGRVAAIRQVLDLEGFSDVGILSYAVKYASAFYGPFREAAGSSPTKANSNIPKDRKTYQMDYRSSLEALREAQLDEEEGADMLMVKPALPYLDILAKLRPITTLPLVAYNVSGEYAMLKAAAAAGTLDEALAVQETLTSIKRAGANLIVSYYAQEALEKGWL